MAARTKRVKHDDRTRDKIRTSQLINRLHDNAFGKVQLDPGQVRSIEILLKKSLADLSAVTITGPEDGPLKIEVLRFADDPPAK